MRNQSKTYTHYSGLTVISQKICPSETCQWDLIWKNGLCRHKEVKNLEMRSSWITQVGAISNDKCPCKRQKRRRHREEKAMQRQTQSNQLCCHRPWNTWGHQQLDETRENGFLDLSEGIWLF